MAKMCRFVSYAVKILLVALLINAGTLQIASAQKCYELDGRPSRCMPKFLNAAYLKPISASNTCGLKKPNSYCLLSGRIGLKKTCQSCDASMKSLSHPATHINDLSGSSWWQSDTYLDNKVPVRILLDLGKTFEIAYVRITFHSPRPKSFAIFKKSSTNKKAKWTPFQYYSQTCRKTYKVSQNAKVTRANQKLALCSNRFSGIMPLSGGHVAFSTLAGRPDSFRLDRSPVLQEWLAVASLRIDLDRMNTFGDEVFGDPDVLRSYYYAISNLVVGGRCKCNGHASKCVEGLAGEGAARFLCECEHNTAGDDCQKCKPLYNDRPWARATRYNANPCSPCDCNGLAESCVYDRQLYRATGRGGRCVGCKNNTDGANCEQCKIYHYKKDANEACKPCKCNPIGSRRQQCNTDGQCTCQPGVYGKKCDQCRPGYVGFSKNGCKSS